MDIKGYNSLSLENKGDNSPSLVNKGEGSHPNLNSGHSKSTFEGTGNNSSIALAPYNCNICKSSFHKFHTFQKHCKIHEDKDKDIGHADIEEKVTGNYSTTMKGKTSKSLENSELSNISENPDVDQERPTKIEGRTKNSKPSYRCSHCGKCLPWNADLIKHMETHFPISSMEQIDDITKTGVVRKAADGRYKCTTCGKYFTSILPLQSHIKYIHSMDISDYKINYNDTEGLFMNPEKVQRIEKKIEEKLRFTAYYSVVKRSRHDKMKANVILQCEFCAQIFKNKKDLNKHRNTKHLTKYKCDICSQMFQQKNHLKEHKRITHGEGDFKSGKIYECEKPNYLKSDLKRNITKKLLNNKEREIHNEKGNTVEFGKNAFKCRRCNDSFQIIEELEQHISTHHSENNFEENNQVNMEIAKQDVMTTQGMSPDKAQTDNISVIEDSKGQQHEQEVVDFVMKTNDNFQNIENGSFKNAGAKISEGQEGKKFERVLVHCDSHPGKEVLQGPQGTSFGNQNMIKCQVINSETGMVENVLIPVEQLSEGTVEIELDTLNSFSLL